MNVVRPDRFRQTLRSANKLHLELAWVSIASAAVLILSIGIGIVVARFLDATDYGRFSYFINLFGLFRLVASIGMTSHIAFQLAQNKGRGRAAGQSFYPMLTVRLLTLGGFALLAILIGYLRDDWILIISGSAAVLALVNDFGVGALQGLKLPNRVIAVLAAQPITYAAGAVAVVINRWPIAVLYWLYLLSFVPAIGLASFWLIRDLDRPKVWWPDSNALLASIRYAGGMYLNAIAGTIFTSVATLYLGGLGRFVDAALITIPLNLVFTASALANMVMATAYFPRQTELFAHQDYAGAQSLLRFFFGMVSAVTMLLAFTLLYYPRTILYILYGQRYLASAVLLASLAFTTFFYTMQTVLTFTLLARRRLRDSILGVLLPNLFLIGGIAWAGSNGNALMFMALAQSLTAMAGFLWQLRKFRSDVAFLLKLSGLQAAVACVLIGLLRLVLRDSPQQWSMTLVLLSLVSTLYLCWVWYRSRLGIEGPPSQSPIAEPSRA